MKKKKQSAAQVAAKAEAKHLTSQEITRFVSNPSVLDDINRFIDIILENDSDDSAAFVDLLSKFADEAHHQGLTAIAFYLYGFLAFTADHLISQFKLGLIHLNIDPEKAFMFFYKAAEHGCLNAQAFLSVMYRKGVGVIRDDAAADMWEQRMAQVVADTDDGQHLIDVNIELAESAFAD